MDTLLAQCYNSQREWMIPGRYSPQPPHRRSLVKQTLSVRLRSSNRLADAIVFLGESMKNTERERFHDG
ncbi:hypothetical protein GCM10009067_32170 [Haloarcula sebkhae]|uniref:Uncharacterized protein n=1 Tax=Haloarcula sebkhae TaxID=932660 RepID=A0A830F344_9EURY|nr:hypothetical protein GCM10009067_32170 [Haloarcula sebkhae]